MKVLFKWRAREGFEPSTTDLEGQCYIQAKPRAHPALDTHLVIKPLPSQGHKNETFYSQFYSLIQEDCL